MIPVPFYACEENRVLPLLKTANGNESLPGRILSFEESWPARNPLPYFPAADPAPDPNKYIFVMKLQ